MSDNKNIETPPERGQLDVSEPNIAVSASEVSSSVGSVKLTKTNQRAPSSSSERQIKFERAQKCLENAALVSKRIKEHRKATAELLGKPFEDDDVADTASEMASTISERTAYSAVTDTSTAMSVQEALNIPGISESLANTLKQKELLMERIKQYKEISKRPIKTATVSRRESISDYKTELKKTLENTDITQMANVIKDKENSLSIMQVKIRALETTILDLQEKINEKDQIIEAKNMATTLMSDNLSKKEKESLILLEDTRQQMTKMQENFIAMEVEWKAEKQKLLDEIKVKDEKLHNLQEANSILENSRFEISVSCSKLSEELDVKNKLIIELYENIEKLKEEKPHIDTVEEEKGSLEISNMVELSRKIELLEQLNCSIRQTNKELENKLATVVSEPKPSTTSSPSKKASPLPTRKGGRNTAAKSKSPWTNLLSESNPQETDKKANKADVGKLEMLIQSLNKDILEKEYAISQKDTLISELKLATEERDKIIKKLQSSKQTEKEIVSKKVDIGVCTDMTLPEETNIKVANMELKEKDIVLYPDDKDLEEKYKTAVEQINALNQEIDAANKNMIKVKSNHKLKLKQMQKTIDNFSKVSNANAEIVKLNEEIHQLSQKVAELEEEKGNLQLHLVDYDSGRLTESDVYKKLVEVENLAETRLKAISVLEAQKFDLVQELHEMQEKYVEMEDKLVDMTQLQNEQVCSEMKSVQLEEQIDELSAAKREQGLVIDNLKLDNEQLSGSIKLLQDEKDELTQKIENYIQENMELHDKLEKLSAEKVSSAESIEIVESLTTQEKLELEEYNKGMIDEHKIRSDGSETFKESASSQELEDIKKLVEQSAELNKKIELFTHERQEVMEKMTNISLENESLQTKILDLNTQSSNLQNTIEILSKEKVELQSLNDDINRQIDELKRERIELLKEGADIAKPSNVEDIFEGSGVETQDDKTSGDKVTSRTKSVKQLTKEILKFKTTIKEREAEIGDCRMKILSLEEQHQKQKDILQNIASYEVKIKSLTEENNDLKEEIDTLKNVRTSNNEYLQLQQQCDILQNEIQKVHQEYTSTINSRDSRIHELENLLVEYEKQIHNFGTSLQQKDKEVSEYINQITKLNDVSQKLKSTIELLEEEKMKDQNAELVKSLNKQILGYQKKLSECEGKLIILDEEKSQLLSVKIALESKHNNYDIELKKLQESLAEKQSLITELQTQQQKHTDEVTTARLEVKERDEEIHEIKLQLRKESIENEKLRNSLIDKDKTIEQHLTQIEQDKITLATLTQQNQQMEAQAESLENKNKELMEKLKKYAVNFKKKSAMHTELENQFIDIRKELESKNEYVERLEQQCANEVALSQSRSYSLQRELQVAQNDLSLLKDSLDELHVDNTNLKEQVTVLNKKLADYDIENKNRTNLITKISSLENEISQNQNYIADLLSKLSAYEQHFNQIQGGYEAKVQERDLYIENIEAEISKYKSRINRLEESISVMEQSRHSVELKADELDNQLQEKIKAYNEYTNQEDELVGRLAVLMDYDRVLKNKLHEIGSENRDLQNKIQHLNDENHHLRNSVVVLQDRCNQLLSKADKADLTEGEVIKYQTQIHEMEHQLKRLTHEHQTLLSKRKHDIDELEFEFNTQIENSIKEKKTLSEKYEKINEHVIQLEHKVNEYNATIQNLNINIEELTRLNSELTESRYRKHNQQPDYTEQYINEINNLNAIVNAKNQKISELINNVEKLKLANASTESNLKKIMDELKVLEHNYKESQIELSQKEDLLKQLSDKKKVSFEMNIPKTEGMIISSTIEALSEEPKNIDISSIQSQIICEEENSDKIIQVTRQQNIQSENKESIEPVITPKKAYLCYKNEVDCPEQIDPFNSDEGWGFGENEETTEVIPGYSHFSMQIDQLKKENEGLKAELESNNNKLLKALKKLKDLKASNDNLTKELNISKQLSQSSMFDSAIESELTNTVQELEKQVNSLQAELAKEKRDKELLRKQNEVFNNANDKLTEMKEKLDNEVELWKYKFKEVNDKLSVVQWGAEKDSPSHQVASSVLSKKPSALEDDLRKLESENDELQSLVDELTSRNNNLLSQQTALTHEINTLKIQAEQSLNNIANCEDLKMQLTQITQMHEELKVKNTETDKLYTELLHSYQEKKNYADNLAQDIKLYKEKVTVTANNEDLKIQLSQITEMNEELKMKNTEIEKLYIETLHSYEEQKRCALSLAEELKLNKDKLTEVSNQLEDMIKSYSKLEIESKEKSQSLLSEIDSLKNTVVSLETQQNTYEDKIHARIIESELLQINQDLDSRSDLEKISLLESCNTELKSKLQNCEAEITDLKEKLKHLNAENNELLSTVAELRSSVTSAVDQRGFEIAELWKQHLAQREADFQKIEHELRTQLTSFEVKYEQLLDSMQSSSQEETSKVIAVEQINSLQNKLQDKEEHLRNLQDQYGAALNQVEMLRSELEDDRVMHENKLLSQQEEYEKHIHQLSSNNQKHISDFEHTFKNIQSELSQVKADNDELNQQVVELQKNFEDSETKILELTNQLKLKDNEIYQKAQDYNLSLSQRNEEFENVRTQLIQYEKKVEDLVYEKESELAVMRLKMHETGVHNEKVQSELHSKNTSLSEALNEKIIECTNLNKQINDLNNILEEHSGRSTEMQLALENQELEIVTLKDEINSLQDALRSSSAKVDKHVTFASDTKPGDSEQRGITINPELLDAVPRAELDLALYMLHQRDVRCEELTMELSHLLEERDTLQLRLSDSLRNQEELKGRCKAMGLDISGTSQESAVDAPTVTVENEFVDTHRGQASRSSSTSNPDGDQPKLQAKLSELRSVRHSRDVTFRQESEQRQLGLRLLQRDVAQLPAAARDQLAQAHHTLSRDSQSTSTVLLNWLRGKSTPKVVQDM